MVSIHIITLLAVPNATIIISVAACISPCRTAKSATAQRGFMLHNTQRGCMQCMHVMLTQQPVSNTVIQQDDYKQVAGKYAYDSTNRYTETYTITCTLHMPATL